VTIPGPVSVSATPASGLTDGQIVAVRAAGLPPEHTIQVEQCAGTAAVPPPDNTACDALTLDTQAGTDAQGNYVNGPGDGNGDTGFRVYTRPSPLLASPTTITCDGTHPCVLYVGVDQNDFSKPHVFADIRFGPTVVAPGQAPVVVTPQAAPAATTTPIAATAVTTTSPTAAPASATAGAPALAFTGGPPLVPGLAALGLAAVAISSLARRRMLQGARP
jgi:Neocarzinostatin family